jgi:5-methylthioadenosine/S-adenosylhomocysteine deaminase
LGWIKEYADHEDLLVHFHLAETREEIEMVRSKTGRPLVPYLDDLGFLGSNLVAAHAIHLGREDLGALARRGVKVVHNPASNMKLASGVFPYSMARAAGVTIALGTDGAASNNSLDMFEAMKLAALLQKVTSGDPTLLPAREALAMATEGGARALGLKAGRVEEGYLADLTLVDLHRPELTPNHDTVSNVVYSAKGAAVDTVVCDGRVLMRKGRVRGEEEILSKAAAAARSLVGRGGV